MITHRLHSFIHPCWCHMKQLHSACASPSFSLSVTRGEGHDRDAARHRFPADGRWLHPSLPQGPEVRPGGDLPTAGPVLPVQTAEPRHVPELQGLCLVLSVRVIKGFVSCSVTGEAEYSVNGCTQMLSSSLRAETLTCDCWFKYFGLYLSCNNSLYWSEGKRGMSTNS